MERQQFSVSGMTCSGCERTLEHAVSQLDGVYSVQANRQTGSLDVRFTAPCTRERICGAVQMAGYSVTDRPGKRSDALYLLIILLGLYVIARQLGWTEIFRAFPTADGRKMGYIALFLTGLLTSVHCIAMCGGLNLAQSMGTANPHPIRGSMLYNLGRLTSYTLIGGVLGFLGEKAAVTLRVRGLIGLAVGVLMLLMGVSMLTGISLPGKFRIKLPAGLARQHRAFKRHGAFAIGLVNGFMPCGPLQSMQLYAIAGGSFLAGAASMFFFCLGTIPLVLLFGATAGILKRSWRQKMLRLGSAMLILIGLSTVQNNLALTGVALPWAGTGGESAVISAIIDGDVQRVTTTLHANGFDDIQVTAGIPVIWTILVEEEALNGCNNEIYIPALNQQVKLEVGATTITFTPEEPGTYPYTCWMGMLQSTITVTEDSI